MYLFITMHNLKKKNNDPGVLDDLNKICKPYCQEFKEFQDVICNTVRVTLYVIVTFLVSIHAEERITLSRSHEEIISILKKIGKPHQRLSLFLNIMGDNPFPMPCFTIKWLVIEGVTQATLFLHKDNQIWLLFYMTTQLNFTSVRSVTMDLLLEVNIFIIDILLMCNSNRYISLFKTCKTKADPV